MDGMMMSLCTNTYIVYIAIHNYGYFIQHACLPMVYDGLMDTYFYVFI